MLSTLIESMLSAQEAARKLGVKPETLYAYVSRGLLTRHGEAGSRRSLYARGEVERLAARSRRGGRAGALELVVDTSLTLLDPAGALYYRGQDATKLARESTYEQVAELLWGGDAAGGGEVAGGGGEVAGGGGETAGGGGAKRGGGTGGAAMRRPAPWAARDVARARSAVDALAGNGARPADWLRIVVGLAAAGDPLRADLRPPAVRHAARGLIATMVDGLPARGRAAAGDAIAARLWARLHGGAPTRAQLRVLDAALILLADHELALSALAARVAASAHADPYLVVLAGLSAQGGPLHGGAGTSVERLLAAIPDAGSVPAVLGERLALGEPLPGFGHAVYTDRDPRADTLLELLERADPHRARHEVLRAVLAATGRHGGPAPNVDLALGALTDCLGLVPGSAEAIFAIARTAGLIAHALEEYPYRLRFRARAAYVGPAPESESD
jgi:citrate synthase